MSLNLFNNFSYNTNSNNLSSLQQKVSDCQTKVQADNQLTNEKNNTLNTLNSDKSQLSSTVSTAQSMVTAAQSVLDAANSLLASAQSMPAEKTTDKDGKTVENTAARDAAISQAMSAVNEANAQLSAAQAEYEQAQNEMQQKEEEAAQAQADADTAVSQLTEDEAALSSAQQELSTAQNEQQSSQTNVNGEIDNDIQQNDLGDCALLSSVFAMAQSDKGAKNIKDSIKINKNENGEETYDVTFSGIGETYTVSASEIKDAQSDDGRQYSTGDDDMALIELAVEKCFKESDDETINQIYGSDDNTSEYSGDEQVDYLNGVNPNLVDYIFTGNIGERVSSSEATQKAALADIVKSSESVYSNNDLSVKDVNGNDIKISANTDYKVTSFNEDGTVDIKAPDKFIFKGDTYTISIDELYNSDYNGFKSAVEVSNSMVDDLFDNYEQDKDSNALVFANMEKEDDGTVGNSTVTDVDGNKVELPQVHAYAVTDVEGDVVTLANPWDTSKELKFEKEELYKLDSFKLYGLVA